MTGESDEEMITAEWIVEEYGDTLREMAEDEHGISEIAQAVLDAAEEEQDQ